MKLLPQPCISDKGVYQAISKIIFTRLNLRLLNGMNSCEWDLILLRSAQSQNDSAFWYAKSWRHGYENVITNVWFISCCFMRVTNAKAGHNLFGNKG